MARVSKPTGKRVSGPTPPKYNDPNNPWQSSNRAAPTVSQVRQYQPPKPANTMGRAQSNQIAISQMQQRQARAMPDRNTPAGYVSPYNQQQAEQAKWAQRNIGAYGTPQPAGMGNVQATGYVPSALTQTQRVNQASAGRYNAAYQQGRWAPDKVAAQKYMGYGAPTYGLTYSTWSDASQQATADRYTAQANRYYNPPAGGGGGGGGWVDYGGGGGGGGYTERPPEWYERMAQWSYGKG